MMQIPGYEGIYEISTNGDVYSIDRKIIGIDGSVYPKKGKKLIPAINKVNGYYYVSLWKGNKGKSFSVHRLVARLFIPNPDNKPEVNHKDGNRLNPCVTNLEWVTSSENSLHSYRLGFSTQKPKRKLTENDYKDILKRFLTGESFAVILNDFPISAGRLSVNLKALTVKWGNHAAYREEIHRQQIARAMVNGNN
jgi:hypothetical protein